MLFSMKLFTTRSSHHRSGMTLIEVVLSISIFALVVFSLYTIIRLGLFIVTDDQSRLDAVSIAQSQIETIKNLPYDDIGTIGGIPDGDIEQTQEIERNTSTFTIETDIRYIDDEFDDLAPLDTVNTDYKQVRVEVSWLGMYIHDPVVLITTISPPGIETNEGGGTLWIEVYNAEADPVVNATVDVTNNDVVPAIAISSATDTDGRYILPGAPASAQTYQITISKSGYSTAQTYEVDPVNNPNPDPGKQTVVEGEVTTKVFYIDELSELQFHVEELGTGTAITGLPLTMTGAKRIGTDLEGADIPKYDQEHTTDGDGFISIPSLEYDTYSVVIDDDATGYDFAGSAPHLPYVLAPNRFELITIHVATNASETLLLTVEDDDEVPIIDAEVHFYNSDLSIDMTQNTNAAGQTFFTPLSLEEFTIDITKDGYQAYTSSISITGDELFTASMLSS